MRPAREVLRLSLSLIVASRRIPAPESTPRLVVVGMRWALAFPPRLPRPFTWLPARGVVTDSCPSSSTDAYVDMCFIAVREASLDRKNWENPNQENGRTRKTSRKPNSDLNRYLLLRNPAKCWGSLILAAHCGFAAHVPPPGNAKLEKLE
eukprot:GHVU01042442.1.p1 GENE.GHVU01042442.1~~GHVU01042442.1.p1  ORF type:complete len:150 (-),score=5.40 GHVU01042442.1:690-1139(-)